MSCVPKGAEGWQRHPEVGNDEVAVTGLEAEVGSLANATVDSSQAAAEVAATVAAPETTTGAPGVPSGTQTTTGMAVVQAAVQAAANTAVQSETASFQGAEKALEARLSVNPVILLTV